MSLVVLGTPLAPVRLSWPRLGRLEKRDGESRDTVSTAVLVPADSPEVASLKTAIAECIKAEWGSTPPKGLKLPIKGGDSDTYPEQEGMVIVNVRSGRLVPVVGPDKHPVDATDENVVYGGANSRVVVRPYAYDARSKRGGVGVSLGLEAVQVLGGGERLGGGGGGEALGLLSAVEGFEDEPDPMAGLI